MVVSMWQANETVGEPRSILDVGHHRPEIVVVEVAVREAHRYPTESPHRRQRITVIACGSSSDTSPPISWAILAVAALDRKIRHLTIDLGEGVSAVHPDLVGVGAVIAGFAAEVALREDAVGGLTPGGASTDQLAVHPAQTAGRERHRRARAASVSGSMGLVASSYLSDAGPNSRSPHDRFAHSVGVCESIRRWNRFLDHDHSRECRVPLLVLDRLRTPVFDAQVRRVVEVPLMRTAGFLVGVASPRPP